jgi:Na+-translocating ferredoxin:NAD+ oxidoreductase subunit G
MPEFVRMIIVLFLTCGLAAGSLSLVNAVTREPIAAWEKKQIEAGLREVFAAADEFKESAITAEQSAVADRQWEALSHGQLQGQIFQISPQGYSGEIIIVFGIDQNNRLTGLKVLQHTETPGLGAKVIKPEFRNQFQQKGLDQLILKKDDPARGTIDSVTAATISSRAVTNAVHATVQAFVKAQGGEQK